MSLHDILCLKVLEYLCTSEWKKRLTPAGIYMWAASPNEEGCIYATAGEQLSDLLPVHIEFSRFSDGSKPNSSPLCCCPSWNNDANVMNIFESSSIVSTFFYFCGKFSCFRWIIIVPFCSFSDDLLLFLPGRALQYSRLQCFFSVAYMLYEVLNIISVNLRLVVLCLTDKCLGRIKKARN